MRTIQVFLTVLVLMSWGGQASGAAPGSETVLRIYIPRAKTLGQSDTVLGGLCVVRCDDAALRARAAAIRMGRAPFAKETIVIDRRTILSRLAANGINTRKVVFTGAPSLRLTRKESVFGSDQILAAAHKYLSVQSPGPTGSGYRLIRKIGELTVASPGQARLSICAAKSSPNGYVKLVDMRETHS